jgi:hypothetical protein
MSVRALASVIELPDDFRDVLVERSDAGPSRRRFLGRSLLDKERAHARVTGFHVRGSYLGPGDESEMPTSA